MPISRIRHTRTNQDRVNLWRPADVFVHQKTHEAVVAAGSGKGRISVVDADAY
jgi:hypothetical protein